MGTSSKPLHILIDQSLYDANELGWMSLRDQGHTIDIISIPVPDIYLAPHAMRMTPDMLLQLPTAFTLAMKGARELRYGPTMKGASTWKNKNAQGKKTRTRKNSTVKVESTVGGEHPPTTQDSGVGGSTVDPVSDPTDVERPEEPTPIGRPA